MVDTSWLRRQIGVVLQESVLFNRTARENIALADPGAPMERVIEAAELAGALDTLTVADVQRYPGQGDDTALKAELGEEVFALAHARGAARSYRQVMDDVFAAIEGQGDEGAR
jgi:hypothetical protein